MHKPVIGKKGNPPASSDAALIRMKAAKPRNTAPEIAVRNILEGMGLSFEVDSYLREGLRRRADIAFRSNKVAIFVDGCFWHGCPVHGTWPKANSEFWRLKIEKNKERDRDTDRRLTEAGWNVVRIWEHEDPDDAASRIVSLLSKST